MSTAPGTLVHYLEREWVVLPSQDPDLLLLRPIGGGGRETCGVWRPLADQMAYSLPFERVEPATFRLPDLSDIQDLAAVRLLQESARLLLRDGAAPFRCLGHISFRPRLYQFVPLMMALQQETVRLLIADDVGVGKTIEAGLIVRELLDRGDIRRVGILCPPYLCDQWQKELQDKFSIDAVVIRSSTLSRLERDIPTDVSVFQYYPYFVASIDLVKGEHYRRSLIQYCPDLLLVDEAHGAAQPPQGRGGGARQQRYALVRELADNAKRHLVLLTATPHSGIESSFLSLLGLLRPELARLDLARLSEEDYPVLARHFVQRRRQHVARWMEEATPFPRRDDTDVEQPYTLSADYRRFYDEVYDFARGIVRSADTLSGWKRRMRYWSALALLRSVTSSPAAAEAALRSRAGGGAEGAGLLEAASDEEVDDTFGPVVGDPLDTENVVDAAPREVFEAQEQDTSWPDSERRRLQQFALTARRLRGEADSKVLKLVAVVDGLLAARYRPIVWCRFIPTADYVAEELQARLEGRHPGLRVTSVTGAIAEDERRLKVEELAEAPRRVLVATDCLSEGINLQQEFDAAIHYDLPWNPNRLEQREGRVDRFGQPKPVVRVHLLYGKDNPVDGAVLEVLLRKARDIRRDLGISVPVPVDSETIIETVLRSLFRQARPYGAQLSLFEQDAQAEQAVQDMHTAWERAAQRQREGEGRFARRAVDEQELLRLMSASDGVLGGPDDVRRFLVDASQRLGFALQSAGSGAWVLFPASLPETVRLRAGPTIPRDVRARLDKGQNVPWRITFQSPTPEGLSYIGRNHPLVESLAEHLFDLAFHPGAGVSPVSRSAVIRSASVATRTTLLLLRLRYVQGDRQGGAPQLAEETLVWGYRNGPPHVSALRPEEARSVLDAATPSATVPAGERAEAVQEALRAWPALEPDLHALLEARAAALAESHRRLRAGRDGAADVVITPRWPADLLGMVVVLPVPGGPVAAREVRR